MERRDLLLRRSEKSSVRYSTIAFWRRTDDHCDLSAGKRRIAVRFASSANCRKGVCGWRSSERGFWEPWRAGLSHSHDRVDAQRDQCAPSYGDARDFWHESRWIVYDEGSGC